MSRQAQADALTRKPGFAGESYTDYTYQVQVRIDDETGETTAFITSEGGDIGKPIKATYADTVVADGIGKAIIAEVRREHYGEDMDDTDPRDVGACSPMDPRDAAALNVDDGGREDLDSEAEAIHEVREYAAAETREWMGDALERGDE